MIRAILTDIEGTTSSISFVKDVLFPYARANLAGFVAANPNNPEVRRCLDEVRGLINRPVDDAQVIAEMLEWIDQDRKVTPLKALQGLIWADGYRRGDFVGHVYDDAVEQMRRWHAEGVFLYIYSSGSVFAQRLLFGFTEYGDLSSLFSGYFDTRIGAKQEPDSYRAILSETGFAPGEMLFLSDVGAELDAAREVGMATCQLVRDGATPAPMHSQAPDFRAIALA